MKSTISRLETAVIWEGVKSGSRSGTTGLTWTVAQRAPGPHAETLHVGIVMTRQCRDSGVGMGSWGDGLPRDEDRN
jgi:hypothetical protein